MLKFFTFLVILFVLQPNLKAQYVDTIRVMDDEGYPVINASVFIVDKIDNVYEIDSASQKLTDIDGKVVYSEDLGSTSLVNTSVDVSKLPAGTYFVQLRNEEQTNVQKFTVTK